MPTERAIVLAAGKGTRMKSDRPKVVHEIAGRSLLGHVLAMLARAAPEPAGTAPDVTVVVGAGDAGAAVAAEARVWAPEASIAVQTSQRGTADAVAAARSDLAGFDGTVFVLFADTPLVRAETLQAMRGELEAGAGVVVLAFEAVDPTGYGRVVVDETGAVSAIVEHKDADPAQREITLCNSGVMAFRVADLVGLLDRIGADNAQGEFYLTDAVALARADGLDVKVAICPEREVMGINARSQLAEAEAEWQGRARVEAMASGVTLVAPDTVWFSHDTALGRDVIIEPNVFFGPGVTVDDHVTIRANCHIEGARIASGAVIGPFARLRPGAVLGSNVRIGNFVEVKNVAMGDGAKANHLSYLGDGAVGADANIGAGTIFCNYDGFNKHRTVIGAGAFVGSNSALVAPVTIGAGAYVGSGSVISKSVPDDALALTRAPQDTRETWAAKFRARAKRAKAGGAG